MKKKIAALTMCTLFIWQSSVFADVWRVPIIIEGTSYYTLESTAQDNSVYITDKSGNKIVEQPFYDVKYDGRGYIVRYHGGKLNNKCTVLDSNFKEVMPVKYNYIEYNKNTKCYECSYSDDSGKRGFDFYDEKFNKISQPADISPIKGTEYYCQKVIDEKSSLANKFYFICDADGNRLIEEGFWYVVGLKGFVVVTRFSDYKKGLYDKDLKPVTDIKYDWIDFDEESQCISLGLADEIRYLGLDAEYKKPVRKLGETGLYTIENEDGSFYFCDETGKIISDKKYYEIYDIYNDKIVVRSGNKYPYKFGMIDNNFNTLFEEEYFAIEGNGEGQFKLYENDKVKHYDKMNEVAYTNLDYKYITPIEGMENIYIYNMRRSEYDDGLSPNKVIIDGDGNALTKFYLNIEPHGEDMGKTITVSAKVGMSDSYRGMLNSDFKLIVPMGPHTLKMIKESGVVFIEAKAGDDIEAYYDLMGNRYATKEEILKIGEGLNNMSDWAKESIEKAINIGIVPEQLQSSYKKNISRKEFCQIAISTYMAKTGDKIDESAKSPFNDVFDKYVTAAYNLGIVKGTGYKEFTPNNNITRQEAAVMLRNLANILEIADTPKKEKFTDESYFADWAKDAIYSVAGIKSGNTYVMAGTEKGKFSPWMNYTREQAIATMLRLYNQSETTQQISQEVKAESVRSALSERETKVSVNNKRNLFADKENRIVKTKDSSVHVFDIEGNYSLIDKDGKLIANFSSDSIGEGLYIFYQDGKKGVIDVDGNVIVEPADVYMIGDVVDGLFTISEGNNRYNIYNTKGELMKSVEKPAGFSYMFGEGYDGKSYKIGTLSGTNLVVTEHLGDMVWGSYSTQDCFIIRLMSEKKAADDFFLIDALPNGEFTAVGSEDLKAYVLNKDGSVKLKTNYGELGYISENKFAAFEKYHTYGWFDKDSEEKCDIIDVNGNIVEKNVNVSDIIKGIKDMPVQSVFEVLNSVKKDKNYHITELDGKKNLTDANGNIIKEVSKDMGGDLFTFKTDDKIGVVDINGNVIVRAKYNENSSAGIVINGLFTMRDGNRFDIYDKNGTLVKSIERPVGFDCENADSNGKRYDITEISGTNVIVREVSEENTIFKKWCIIRLMSEKKTAEEFLKIKALPNGRFTAICVNDMRACILTEYGSVDIRTKYGELYYMGENRFAAFKEYNTDCDDYEKRVGESYDIIDGGGNLIKSDVTYGK